MGVLNNPYGSLMYLLLVVGLFGLLVFALVAITVGNWEWELQAGLHLLKWAGVHVNLGFTYEDSYFTIKDSEITRGNYNETSKMDEVPDARHLGNRTGG